MELVRPVEVEITVTLAGSETDELTIWAEGVAMVALADNVDAMDDELLVAVVEALYTG